MSMLLESIVRWKLIKSQENLSQGIQLKLKGAVLFSRSSDESPLFSNMRFLVVEGYQFALLIGAKLIYRYGIMSLLGFGRVGVGLRENIKQHFIRS